MRHDWRLPVLCQRVLRPCQTLVLLALASSAIAQTPSAGRLVIVGGALKPSHADIYKAAMESKADASLVAIVPLASGVPEESGPLSVQDFQAHTEQSDQVYDTKVTYRDGERAASQDFAAELQKCRAVWFTGGDQSRILSALRPSTGDVAAYRSLLQLLTHGGTIGGSSAGAAMMCDPMIRSGQSDEAMVLGSTATLDGPGVCIGQGMGFFPYGFVDQHFLQRGRFGRLLVALEATDRELGFGISENCALVAELSTGQLSTIGKQAVVVIDRTDAVTDGRFRSNLRIHLLGSGDSFDTDSRKPAVSEKKTVIDLTRTRLQDDADVVTDVWGRGNLVRLWRRLANEPLTQVSGSDGYFTYRFSTDESSHFYRGAAADDSELTFISLRLDIDPKPDIEERAQALKAGNRTASPAAE